MSLVPHKHPFRPERRQQAEQEIVHRIKAVASVVQVKGVTFNNDGTGEARQDILDRLRMSAQSSSGTGLPVLLMREPDNPVDPEAVAVMSSLVCDGG